MEGTNAPDRRAVLRAAVWSAPVIAVTAATPLAAASAQALSWTWTAQMITSRQAQTNFTATNSTDDPIDVVFVAPRLQGAVELYGYGFGSWAITLTSTAVVCTATVPAQGSLTTPFLGYFTRTPPTTEVLVGSLTPSGSSVPTLTLTFT
ncbi:hypothetical protein [Microbacterium sp. NPDC087591]|uniref:hypothetical protein n=1 Tax=Microbacterium sp. NPDC087591 TaxID=3364192 RepID=UPI0038292FE0